MVKVLFSAMEKEKIQHLYPDKRHYLSSMKRSKRQDTNWVHIMRWVVNCSVLLSLLEISTVIIINGEASVVAVRLNTVLERWLRASLTTCLRQ
jgi:hypothetical protein